MSKIRRLYIIFPIILALFMIGTVAHASLYLVDRSTKTEGATTITWDSSFQDFDYTIGDTITMTVNWAVEEGAGQFAGFTLKKFTPKSKKDPAEGELLTVTHNIDDRFVTVNFLFDQLHLDKRREVEIGNAHFKLMLNIDEDGDGEPDEVEGFGVNVHVEDPY